MVHGCPPLWVGRVTGLEVQRSLRSGGVNRRVGGPTVGGVVVGMVDQAGQYSCLHECCELRGGLIGYVKLSK